MANLLIKTRLNSIVLVGEYCGWDVNGAVRYDRKKGQKLIHCDYFPKGEYKVLSCKAFGTEEVYPTDGRKMPSRYFNGKQNETIYCYFEKEI
jgi:hypothetical protein